MNFKNGLFFFIIFNTSVQASNAGSGAASSASPTKVAPLTQQQTEALEKNLKTSYAILAQRGATPHPALCEQAVIQGTAYTLAQSAYLTYSSQVTVKTLPPITQQENEDDAARQEYGASVAQAVVNGMKKEECDISEVEKLVLNRHGALKKKNPESELTSKHMYRAGLGGFALALGIAYVASCFWPKPPPKVRFIYG